MSDASCCYSSGGRVVVTLNGKRYSIRSTVTVVPWNVERSAEANQDGSMFVTTKPMPYEADLTFSDACKMDIAELQTCSLDVTIELVDVRRTYWFTQAIVVGRPSINTMTGEISGMKIMSPQMTYRNG